MIIRPALSSDVDDISRIISVLDSSHMQHSDRGILAGMISQHEYVVAEDESRNKTIGAMSLVKHRNRSLEIHTLATNPRLQGTGTELIRFAVSKAKELRIPRLYCWSAAVFGVKEFYEKNGFAGKLHKAGTQQQVNQFMTRYHLDDEYHFTRFIN